MLVILVASGMTVEARAEQVERQSYAVPGQLVDIGGGQLIHIRTWGHAVPGRPTIVHDASAGMPSSEAGLHRDQVAGLVLLDTTDPDGGGGPGFALHYRLMAWGAHLGLYQLFPPGDEFWELPVDERPAADAVSKWASFLDTAAEELEAWDTSAAELRAIGTLGDMPLLVVCSPSSPEHIRQQRDLTTLSTNARYVELNVDHMGIARQPRPTDAHF